MSLKVGDVLFVEHVPTGRFYVLQIKARGGPAPAWAMEVARYQRAELILEHAEQVGLANPTGGRGVSHVVIVSSTWVRQCRRAATWPGRSLDAHDHP